MNSESLVAKVWNFAHVLRDQGVSYQAYISQISYLLFLKMDEERVTGPSPHDITETWTLGGAPPPHYAGWERFKAWVTDRAQGGKLGNSFSNKAFFTLKCK